MNNRYTVLIPVYPSDLVKENEGEHGVIVPTSGSGVRFEINGKKIGYGRTDEDNHIMKLGCNSYAVVNAADIQEFMRYKNISEIKTWLTYISSKGHYYFVLEDGVYGKWSPFFQLYH